MRAFQPWLMPDLLFSMSKYATIQKEALAVLHGHTRDTIRQRREAIRAKKAGETTQVEDDLSKFILSPTITILINLTGYEYRRNSIDCVWVFPPEVTRSGQWNLNMMVLG